MARDPHKMARWRYRTAVLTGPWHSTIDEAVADAVARELALRDETQPLGLRWRVPGRIESDADDACAQPTEP